MKKTGRKYICPCGSKLEYRNCCLNNTLMSAYQQMQAGRFLQAESLCQEALAKEPDHPDALHLSGMIRQKLKNYELAIEMMKRSIRVSPGQPAFYCNLGDVYREMNQFEEAVSCYQQALKLDPGNAEALNNLGVNLKDLGRPDDAVAAYLYSIAVNPGYAVAHYNLGDVLKILDRTDEAMASYRKSFALDPNLANTMHMAGLSLFNNGMLDEAMAFFKELIALKPGHAKAHVGLGVTFYEQGRLDEAIAGYRKAIAIEPGCVWAYSNLGTALTDRGMLDEAIVCYRKALSLKPDITEVRDNRGNTANSDHVAAYVGLGVIHVEKGMLDEAIDCYRQAVAIDPGCVWAHNNLGNVFNEQGRFDEAIACFRKALSLKPDFAEAHGNMGNALKNSCRFDEGVASFERALSIKPDHMLAFNNLLLTYQYLYSVTNEEIFARSVEFGRRCESPAERKRHQSVHERERGESVRVGLVSGDLRNHPVGYFLEAALRHMDRDAFSFVAYANQHQFDGLSERIRPFFSEWVRVIGMSDEELASRIRSDGIDILVDLSGHTAFNRLPLFALRPAPVQVSWIGYANTTGMTSIDYILADPVTVPVEEERYYTEKVWRLPDTYLCFTPPDVDIAVDALPGMGNGHITFGSFSNAAKLNDTVLSCWAKILLAVPESQLFLKFRSFEHQTERDDLIGRLQALGIDAARLLFEGQSLRSDYLAAYRRIDFALDPFPFPGATTTCEAAWMGVPSLTLRTARGIVGHNGELIMKSVGLGEWVAGSIDEYVEKARTFAGDTATLAGIRAGLRQRLLNSPLCDGERFAKHLADAFKGMLEEFAAPDQQYEDTSLISSGAGIKSLDKAIKFKPVRDYEKNRP